MARGADQVLIISLDQTDKLEAVKKFLAAAQAQQDAYLALALVCCTLPGPACQLRQLHLVPPLLLVLPRGCYNRYFDDDFMETAVKTCHRCGDPGHLARDCTAPIQRACPLCAGFGHSKRDCPNSACPCISNYLCCFQWRPCSVLWP